MPQACLNPAPRRLERLTQPLQRALQHPWVSGIVRASAVEDSLQALHPLLSLSQVRARVLRVVQETPDTRCFVLQTNTLWRGAQAGQYVGVQAEVNGRRVQRCYSLSSEPGARELVITVKRQPGGLLSEHLHSDVQVGSVLTLTQAMGDFTLPALLPDRLLLLSAGSGITPVMSMLRALHATGYAGDLLFVHACRTPENLIFASQLHVLAAEWPNLRLHLHFTQQRGRLGLDELTALVPDLASRPTWVCGPGPWMHALHQHWLQAGYSVPLHSERFGTPPVLNASADTPAQVLLERSGKRFETQGGASLLEQAERAGLQPAHGCRMGICRACQCTKRSGTVQNLQTGELCSEPDQAIRLCISAARSDIRLDL
jgi:ferredoxin-NADP reductase